MEIDEDSLHLVILERRNLDNVLKVLTSNGFTFAPENSEEPKEDIIHADNSYFYSPTNACGPKIQMASGPSPDVVKAKGNPSITNSSHVKLQTKLGNAAICSASGTCLVPLMDSEFLNKEDSHIRSMVLGTPLSNLAKLLNKAVEKGDLIEVKRLVASGTPFSPAEPFGMSPLQVAVERNSYEICQVLIASGIDINTSNKLGKTALHLAATNGQNILVQMLLQAGAIVDKRDMMHMTPIHWACENGHLFIVHLLLDKNAPIDQRNKFKKLPRDLAFANRHMKIVYLLEKHQERKTLHLLVHGNTTAKEKDFTPELDDSAESITSFTQESPNREPNLASSSSPQLNVPFSKTSPSTCESSEIMNDATEEINIGEAAFLEEERADHVLHSLSELLRTTTDEKNCLSELCGQAASEILKAEAALKPTKTYSLGHWGALHKAIALGRTIQLTEAGRKALQMIQPEPIFLPSNYSRRETNEKRSSKDKKRCSALSKKGIAHNGDENEAEKLDKLLPECSSNFGTGPALNPNDNIEIAPSFKNLENSFLITSIDPIPYSHINCNDYTSPLTSSNESTSIHQVLSPNSLSSSLNRDQEPCLSDSFVLSPAQELLPRQPSYKDTLYNLICDIQKVQKDSSALNKSIGCLDLLNKEDFSDVVSVNIEKNNDLGLHKDNRIDLSSNFACESETIPRDRNLTMDIVCLDSSIDDDLSSKRKSELHVNSTKKSNLSVNYTLAESNSAYNNNAKRKQEPHDSYSAQTQRPLKKQDCASRVAKGICSLKREDGSDVPIALKLVRVSGRHTQSLRKPFTSTYNK